VRRAPGGAPLRGSDLEGAEIRWFVAPIPPDLLGRRWLFDLDGTLTVAMHDFAALKRALGLPAERPVLEGIAERPVAERSSLLDRVARWEWEHAARAEAAVGAHELLSRLAGPVGIVTRNRRDVALRTLAATGLDRWFRDEHVLGRDEAPPKPAPDGLLRLLDSWGVAPEHAVFIGDHGLDVAAGRAAGVVTVHLTRGPPAPRAHHVVGCLSELLPTT